MQWGNGRRSTHAAGVSVIRLLLAAACAGALAGCKQDLPSSAALHQPRGATVAFESIDGLPPAQFQTLVRNLNDEAQSRRLAVISRESTSAYRVRGYLSATVQKNRTTVSWVWDVFDGDAQRALRITGEETAKEPTRDVREAWNAADDAMLRRIAASSMDQLTAFLTSPDVAPASTVAVAQVSFAPDKTPEAAGIFRIFRAQADPAPADASAAVPINASVPLPPRRPEASAAAGLSAPTVVASQL